MNPPRRGREPAPKLGAGRRAGGYEGERRNQNNMNRNEDLAPTT